MPRTRQVLSQNLAVDADLSGFPSYSGLGIMHEGVYVYGNGTLLQAAPDRDTAYGPGGGTGDPGPGPSLRSDYAICFDPSRNRIYIFGGINASGNALGDMWALGPEGWTELHPAQIPSPRVGARMVFCPTNGKVVLFGGRAVEGGSLNAFYDDTWTFDGTTWTDTGLVGPSPRQSMTMGWDPISARILLLGGYGNGLDSTLMWRYDGAGAGSWSSFVLIDGRNPVAGTLRDGALAFDSTRNRLVYYGGTPLFGGAIPVDVLWEWDGTIWSWGAGYGDAGVVPSPSPGGGAGFAFFFDPELDACVLFGGNNGGSSIAGSTWKWDGLVWTLLSPATSPPPRTWVNGVYCPGLPAGFIFGGSYGGTFLSDFWYWRAGTWAAGSPFPVPPVIPAFDVYPGSVDGAFRFTRALMATESVEVVVLPPMLNVLSAPTYNRAALELKVAVWVELNGQTVLAPTSCNVKLVKPDDTVVDLGTSVTFDARGMAHFTAAALTLEKKKLYLFNVSLVMPGSAVPIKVNRPFVDY